MDAIEQFRASMRARGLDPPPQIEPGKLHRFATNGKRGDDAGWCRLFADCEGGVFGDFRSGLSETWQAQRERPFTSAEREAFRRRCEAECQERKAEQARRHAEARDKARALWAAATPARGDHPYLTRKAVAPVVTLREFPAGEVAEALGYVPKSRDELLTGRLLIVPVKVGGELSTVEMIDEDGRKSAVYGGAKVGGYWAAQPLPEGSGEGLTLLIGEGVATVLSAREATGHPVIAALYCSGLEPVAKAMRDWYPAADIVILADLVKATGETDPHAIQAARVVGGRVAVPDFGENRPEGASDFNDLALHCGWEAVQRAIGGAAAPDGENGRRDPGADNATGGDPDWRAAVERLAGLHPIEYDRVRQAEAEALGVRVTTLDAEVEKLRAEAAAGGPGGQGAAVLFGPLEPWPEPVDGAELVADFTALFRRHHAGGLPFVVLPEHADVAIALWIVFTYCIGVVNIAPILALTSPEKRCGKSTVLALLGRLVLRPCLPLTSPRRRCSVRSKRGADAADR